MAATVVAAGALALLVARGLAGAVHRAHPGTAQMQELAAAIQEGAMAFLAREYRVLVVFVTGFAALLLLAGWAGSGDGFGPAVAAAFVLGATASLAAGYGGMRVATAANVRTASVARRQGLRGALGVAFAGGAVMGLCVVGLGLLGLGVICLVLADPARPQALAMFNGFALGASSVALFARVGGGIYTKAADMGADLVGKLEAGIPEDDPRNPAVIADNVGDNVGDVAGMGADLFESYVGSVVAAVVVAAATGAGQAAVLYPLALAALGAVASVAGILAVRLAGSADPGAALRAGSAAAAILVALAGALLAGWLGLPRAAVAMVAGLVAGLVIGVVTEYYTSSDRPPVRQVARSSSTGTATNILSGFAVGLKSTALPV
ncbi:MAG: sodium-translocating pyrophosphatase, partial [Bacillota bacterium]